MHKIKTVILIVFIISFVMIFFKNGYYETTTYEPQKEKENSYIETNENNLYEKITRKDCNMSPFVTKNNEFVECSKLCGNDNYGHIYVEDSTFINVDNRIFSSGSYCLPKTVLYCNTSTSLLVKISHDKWECRPKWKEIFDNDIIKVCNGYLYDNKYNVMYDFKVPQNIDLSKDGPYEHLEDSVPRFVCADEVFPNDRKYAVLDNRGNHKIRPEYSTFSRITNVCTLLLNDTKNSTNRPDYLLGVCDCSDDYKEKLDSTDLLQYTCSSCLNNKIYKSPDGISYPMVSKACIKSYDVDVHTDERISLVNKLPCGKKTFNIKTEACVEGKLLISKDISQYAQKILKNV